MSMTAYALTTNDNPYNPFTEFDAWYAFDLNRELTHKHESYVNCCAILDRFAHTSDALSDSENLHEIENAINKIIALDLFGVYKKVTSEVEEVRDVEPRIPNTNDTQEKI